MCLKYLVDILSEVATWCNHDPTPDPIITIKYGALYNWYAATDAREICNTGWHIPDNTDLDTLRTYLGGVLVAGGALKENSLSYWLTPNTGATNLVGFNGRGGGYRDNIGFGIMKSQLKLWSVDSVGGGFAHNYYLNYNNAQFNGGIGANPQYYGFSLRPLKNSTTLTHGQTGTYTGNDGRIYRTICIDTQEWVADNIAETKYRDGSDIPVVTDDATWAALVTGAMCYYNNDISNM